MDSSLSPILNTQPINDYFKNIPRIWPLNTSTAPTLFEPPCLDYCNSLPTSLSLIPPFLPSLPLLKTGAKEILLKCKSDHVTQSLGPAPHYIQSKHRVNIARPCMIRSPFTRPFWLHLLLFPLNLSFPVTFGSLVFHKCVIGMLRLGASYGLLLFCLNECSSSRYPSS